MLPTWINFGGILSKNFFMNCFIKFETSFSPIKHSICYILGMVSTVDVKQKEMSQLGATLIRVPLTLTFDPEFWRSNCISGMGLQGQIWNLLYLSQKLFICHETKANISIEC